MNFKVDSEMYKEFSKRCIDLEKSKTDVLVQLIKDFLKRGKQ